MESGCVELDDRMNSDLLKTMDENTERVKSDFAENSFQRLSGSGSSSPQRLRKTANVLTSYDNQMVLAS